MDIKVTQGITTAESLVTNQIMQLFKFWNLSWGMFIAFDK
jgi:hypothetical protein